MTRQAKTPQQRAEETLAVAERRAKRLADQVDTAHRTWQALEAELVDAEKRLEYARQDPALQQSTTTSSTTNPAGATT